MNHVLKKMQIHDFFYKKAQNAETVKTLFMH